MKKTVEKKVLLQDTFKLPEQSWHINESDAGASYGKVDGQNILARVEGAFFLVDDVSLNNRLYSKELWENCINKVEPRFQSGGIPGTIGHDQPLDEKALMDGNISHLVSRLWINENNIGMGEILVLGTESGRNLNTCLRAGMPIPVSSRAFGKISGQGKMGEDIIDPESFVLESFDFVLNPGVQTAYPKVVESNKSEEDDNNMDKEQALQAQLNEANVAKLASVAELAKLTEDNQKLRKVVDYYKATIGLPKEVPALLEGLRKWIELEPFKSLADKTNFLNSSGFKATDFARTLTESLSRLATYSTPEQVDELKATIKAHEANGSLQHVETAFALLEQYSVLGSPTEVKAQLSRGRKVESLVKEVRRKAASKQIAEKFNVNAEVIYEMLKKSRTKEVIATVRKLTEAKKDNSSNLKVNESKESKPALSIVKNETQPSLGSKLFASLTKTAAV